MKNKTIIMILILLLQVSIVSSVSDKIIKVSFVINDKDHMELEKFEVTEGEYKNFAEAPSLYHLQIKNKKGEIIGKSNFAPAFFLLSSDKLTKLNQTTISREFLYEGDRWKFLEIYKEDKFLYQADIEEKFCKETKLCNKWLKATIYGTLILTILLSLIYLFLRKRRMVSFK